MVKSGDAVKIKVDGQKYRGIVTEVQVTTEVMDITQGPDAPSGPDLYRRSAPWRPYVRLVIELDMSRLP